MLFTGISSESLLATRCEMCDPFVGCLTSFWMCDPFVGCVIALVGDPIGLQSSFLDELLIWPYAPVHAANCRNQNGWDIWMVCLSSALARGTHQATERSSTRTLSTVTEARDAPPPCSSVSSGCRSPPSPPPPFVPSRPLRSATQ
eukprot:77670-Chlamydomonas_euryale.AAC.1